jgi:hypothetical protein
MSVFAKCQRAKRNLADEGLWTDVVYYDKNGWSIGENVEENASSCVVMSDDKALSDDLAKANKYGGAWSTASKFLIDRDSIRDADITLNQASCKREDPDTEEYDYRYRRLSLLDLVGQVKDKDELVGNTCKVTELHVHNGRSPAAHLHVECNNSSMDTIDTLTGVILEANIYSNQLCQEGRDRSRESNSE